MGLANAWLQPIFHQLWPITVTPAHSLQCQASGAARYSQHEESYLALGIPLEAASNKDAVEAYKVGRGA